VPTPETPQSPETPLEKCLLERMRLLEQMYMAAEVERIILLEAEAQRLTGHELPEIARAKVMRDVAAKARRARSKTLRERTIAQGIDEETKGWDRKHRWKKAGEIHVHGAINARLEEARLKTISVSALYQRLLKIV
jgi:hypothetical protein